jgi:hypothetical protein
LEKACGGEFLGPNGSRPKQQEARENYDEKHHNLYSLSDISRMIKSKTLRSESHVARMGEMRSVSIIFVKSQKGRSHLVI